MDPSEELFQTRLEASQQSGHLGDLEIEFWRGGGQPPPYYRSEQLRLFEADRKPVLELAVLKWDEAYNPPNLQEKWRMPLAEEQIKEVVGSLLRTQALVRTFPEEADPKIADLISYEIIVTTGGRQTRRRYYRRMPEPLAAVGSDVATLSTLVRHDGQYGLYHKGNRLR
jgi:hypothetical protein